MCACMLIVKNTLKKTCRKKVPFCLSFCIRYFFINGPRFWNEIKKILTENFFKKCISLCPKGWVTPPLPKRLSYTNSWRQDSKINVDCSWTQCLETKTSVELYLGCTKRQVMRPEMLSRNRFTTSFVLLVYT